MHDDSDDAGSGAADDVEFTDPITMEPLVRPVLASDGITYSAESIVAAMAADPWHRSPITGEVLRQLAYPNTFVAQYMDVEGEASPVQLYDAADWPVDARVSCFTLPISASAEECLVRANWKLPIQPIVLQVVLRRTELNEWWVMHPPPAVNAEADFRALGAAFGLNFARNPHCITTANFVFQSPERVVAVESWWLHQRMAQDV